MPDTITLLDSLAGLSAPQEASTRNSLSVASADATARADLNRATIRNNVADATNDIDVLAGTEWVSDGTNWIAVTVPALTKRIDATWAVGTNQGGLDAGSKANSTWYYVYVIYRTDTGVTDVLLSTSSTAPTMPSNYTYRRCIGEVFVRSSGVLLPFVQIGDEFWLVTASLNFSSTSPPATLTGLTMTAPPTAISALVYGAVAHVPGNGSVSVRDFPGGNFNLATSESGHVIVGRAWLSLDAGRIYHQRTQASGYNFYEIYTVAWRSRRI